MSEENFDDLDDLKSALKTATPSPDPAKKAKDIALAKKNFDDLQGSRGAARLTSDRPANGLVRGVRTMIANLSTRAALTATTAVLAVGLVVTLPQLMEKVPPSLGGRTSLEASPEYRTTQPADPDQGIIRQEQEDSAEGTFAFESEAAPEVLADQAAPTVQPIGEIANIASTPSPAAKSRGLSSYDSTAGSGRVSQMQRSDDIIVLPGHQTEAYPEAGTNPLRITTEEPVSTFSIDADTASYAILRNTITSGRLPSPEMVRIEEMINYFPYEYPAPSAGQHPFKPTVSVVPTPWNQGTQLVHIAIQGKKPAVEERPPLNLVFLIDTSGSMNQPNKLPLLKQSLALMLSQLGEADQVSIVTYAGSAGQVLPPTPASQRSTILNALENLSAGGSTAGQAGLQQAYSVAEAMAEDGEVTRVVLATDGDFNVGLSDPGALKDYIAQKRETGTYLSVMGFGRGNLDDATMQALAQNGNGQAAYIDTLSEAQKVLVDQFSGALFPIADDVKIQVEFNPARISEYRLIGYETRQLRREDFNNDKVDAGDIGSGTNVTAIYEVTPVGSAAQLNDPLRYRDAETAATIPDELGYLKLRYKAPGSADSTLIEMPIQSSLTEISGEAGFAIAIASFGELLKNSSFSDEWGYQDAIALATANKGQDTYGYRSEAIRLMRLAQSLSQQ